MHELLFELHGNCQFLDTPLARMFLTKLRTTNQSGEIPFAGELLSWFVAEVLPFSDKERADLLREDSTVARLVAAIELIEHLVSDDKVLLQEAMLLGQSVRHLQTGELAVVVAIDQVDWHGQHLTIQMRDGTEVQTCAHHLKRADGVEGFSIN